MLSQPSSSRRKRTTIALAALLGASALAGPSLVLQNSSSARPGADAPAETLTGVLTETVADEFESGRAQHGWALQSEKATYALENIASEKARSMVGREVKLRAKAKGKNKDHVVVEEGSVELAADGTTTTTTTTSATPLAPLPAGARNTAVILMNFTDDTRLPGGVAETNELVFGTGPTSVTSFVRDTTDEKVSLTGSTFGPYTVSRPSATSCDYATWSNAASTAATNAGVAVSGYTHVVYVWPQQSACGWAGMGSLPGRNAWINGAPSARIISHELGHNFGEHHATSARCTDAAGSPVAFSNTCSYTEYGDPFSVMGGSLRLHHASARHHYGHVQAADVSGTGGDYTLVPSDSPPASGAVRLVRVPRGNGTFLSLEFRQPTGAFDTFALGSPVTTGVTVRVDEGSGSRPTRLLDTTPATASFEDAPLARGASWTDPVSGVTLTVMASSGSSATVRVALPGSASPQPTAPTGDTVAPSPVSGLRPANAPGSTSVSLTWSPATDNVGVSGYRVSRDGAVVENLPASVTSHVSQNLTPSTNYFFEVVALDAAGNVSPPSATGITTAAAGAPAPDPAPVSPSPSPTSPPPPPADTTAPSAVSGLGATPTTTSVALTWSAASDNVGVSSYRIIRNGAVIASVPGNTLSYTNSGLPSSTSYTYAVAALDAAGNLGPAASVSTRTSTPPDTTAPSAVSNLTVSVNSYRQARVAWTAASDNRGVTGYRVVLNTTTYTTTSTAWTSPTLTKGSTYTVKVSARDAAGNWGPAVSRTFKV